MSHNPDIENQDPTKPEEEEEENPAMQALIRALLEGHIASEIVSFSQKSRTRRTRIGMGSQRLKNKTYDSDELPAEEIVIKDREIKVKYSYPLNEPHLHVHKTENPEGFTRKELYEQISAHYHAIYAEEDAAVGPTSTVTPNMFNRAKSNGPYGIWGHYISDLTLEDVYATDEGVYDMDISS